jgi:hypothetical protein
MRKDECVRQHGHKLVKTCGTASKGVYVQWPFVGFYGLVKGLRCLGDRRRSGTFSKSSRTSAFRIASARRSHLWASINAAISALNYSGRRSRTIWFGTNVRHDGEVARQSYGHRTADAQSFARRYRRKSVARGVRDADTTLDGRLRQALEEEQRSKPAKSVSTALADAVIGEPQPAP